MVGENFRNQGKFYQTLKLRIAYVEEINNCPQDSNGDNGAEGVT
jgi:hypothetical protein